MSRTQRLLGKIERVPVQRGLRWVFGSQVVLAGLLLASDGISRLAFPSRPPAESIPDGPISPGDQTRRYDPDRLSPRLFDPANRPNMELTTNFPTRMEFTAEDSDVLGPHVLINGPVEEGDSDRLAEYLATLPEPPGLVALNSPGGVVTEALAIGRILREAELPTAIGPGAACLSSCPYMLAGGTERRVSRAGAVGLHQHYYEEPGYMPVYFAVENIQRGQGMTMEYLIEMDVDPGVMVYGLQTPPEDIYVLIEDELTDSRLATEMID